MLPLLTVVGLLVGTCYASAEDYCEGASCPGAAEASGDCTTLQEATFLLAAIACAGVVFDLLQKYVFVKDDEEKDKQVPVEEKKEQVTHVSAASVATPPAPPPTQLPEIKEEEVVVAQTAAPTTGQSPARKVSKTEEDNDMEAVKDTNKGQEPAKTAPQKEGSDNNVGSADPESLRDFVANLLDAMRTRIDLRPSEGDLPGSCQEQLEQVASLEKPCKELSAEIEKCSVAMVASSPTQAQQEEDQPEAEQGTLESSFREQQAALQKRTSALRGQWTSIRRLFYCVDMHLRNATAYQQYYYETRELKSQLAEYIKQTNAQAREPAPVVDTPEALEQLIKDTKVTNNTVRLWEAHVNQLSDQSKATVPVKMRSEPITEPQPIKTLCAYTTPELTVDEGEQLMLTNNDNAQDWKVETVGGEETVLPAITCLIPPPDKEALTAAAKLRRAMNDTYQATRDLQKKRFAACTKDMLLQLLRDKAALLEVIHPEHKEELLDDISTINDVVNTYFSDEENYPELCQTSAAIRKLIEGAKEEGDEDEAFIKEVKDMIANLAALLNMFKRFDENFENFHRLHYNAGQDDNASNDEEWDTLDDVDQATAAERSLDVNVARERAQQGEATSFMSSSAEMRQTFSIKSVIDPTTEKEISMDDAVARGIVDRTRGVYHNPSTRKDIPIAEAMTRGLILVESTQTKKTRELVQAVGVVTVTFTRETRPYTIRRVLDPRNDTEVTVDEAIEQEIFDADRGVWRNPDTGDETSIENAIDCGGLIVDYDPDASVGEPDVSTKTFAVYGVMDRREGKRLPFYEASQRGLIDKEAGMYLDNLTGKNMSVVDALRQGFLKARVVTDEQTLDLGRLSKQLSGSTESLESDGSK